MSLFRATGQFDDADDDTAAVSAEQKLAGDLAQATAASRFSAAASRAAAMGFAPGAALARAAAERSANSGAAASYLSMLQNAAAGDPNSPYFQRQTYRPTFMNTQSPYGGLPSAEASLAYARHAGTYPYGAAPGPSPENGAQGYPGTHSYTSPHAAARDFASYYQRQAQDLSSAALLDRAYQLQENNKQMNPGQAVATSTLQFLSKGQSTVKRSPSSGGTAASPRTGRGGRGGPGGGRGGRGGGRGRVGRGGRGPSRSSPAKNAVVIGEPKGEHPEVDALGQRWYSGCVPLGLPEDKYWLSELQVYLRSNFAEAFGATEADIAAPMHGRNKPIALGQVGIRCMHCRNDPPSERGQQATSYPSLISGIYNSVQQMLRLHYDCCMSLPADVRAKVEQLKVSSSARGGRKQYWIDSAKRLGLVDTPHGIHFGRDPYGPLPPLSGPSATAEAEEKKKRAEARAAIKAEVKPPIEDTVDEDENEEKLESEPPAIIDDDPVEHYPLVEPEDMALISDYLYLTLEQMSPCNLMEADKVGCYKGRKVGFRGLACKHCVGQAGCGRYFPASEASLSQTTTSQTIMNHVRNCRRCPVEIRENLELMKRARMGPDGKRADKPKHGGRKVFFHRLWCRIQGVPLSDDECGKKKGSGTWSRKKKDAAAKKAGKKKRSLQKAEESDVEDEGGDDEKDSDESSETETEDEDSSGDGDDDDVEPSEKSASKTKSKTGRKKESDVMHEGCVRLTKTDDPHWLSEMQCYVRSDLVEVYSLKKKDSLDGYAGRKEPEVMQVGIRCVFCKALPRDERSSGCVYFPDSLASIQTKVGDMIRLHFPSCPAMPDDVKSIFRSLRGFGAKADGDAQQYWIDAARDIGLTDVPPGEQGWGIYFRRDPLQPSPADNLDRELAGAAMFQCGKNSLVKAEDKGMCTDHAILLLRQIKPCRFKKTDRRGGPGARGRDRVIGFPGVSCRYCSSKNNFGRYFPVSAKNLTDNTANSLQAHMMSCTRCPEPVKASLAYLVHRATLQKAELSGSWKKTFFKRVWERLHLERAWTRSINGSDDEEEDSSSEEEDIPIGDDDKVENGGSDSDEVDLGDDMADLVKAAAVWLSEQEANNDSFRIKNARGRSLPSKRPLPFARGRATLTDKRRKVTA
jgi:hypothetical protein